MNEVIKKLKAELLENVVEEIKKVEQAKKTKIEIYEQEIAGYDEELERLKTLEKAYKTIK